MGVSLIQSNAAGFGSWLVEPNTGINLHNRGLGFNLDAGHPAEFGPGRRPPHTLSPALASRGGDLVAVFGTMGGDAQPQILLQLAARLFRHGQSADRGDQRRAVGAARAVDRVRHVDRRGGTPIVQIEGHTPDDWYDDLARRGHSVERTPAFDSAFGHAHAIVVEPNGVLAGCADPRTVVGQLRRDLSALNSSARAALPASARAACRRRQPRSRRRDSRARGRSHRRCP